MLAASSPASSNVGIEGGGAPETGQHACATGAQSTMYMHAARGAATSLPGNRKICMAEGPIVEERSSVFIGLADAGALGQTASTSLAAVSTPDIAFDAGRSAA